MTTPTESTVRPFNAVNWFEIPTRDLDRATHFYERVVGRPLRREVFGGLPHAIFPSKCASGADSSVAGALVADAPYLTPGTRGTVIYLDCPDGVQASLARAIEAGAALVQPHLAIGPNGFIAIIDDPEGNRVGLHAMQA